LPVYVPREQNVIQKILKDHFQEFENCYEEKYADKYGKFSISRRQSLNFWTVVIIPKA